MPRTIRAVYEVGLLRPLQPLALPEGETVDLTIAQAKPAGTPLRAATPAEEDYRRRIMAAKSLEEMFAVMATAPLATDDNFDIVALLNDSRRQTGFRMPDPDPGREEPR